MQRGKLIAIEGIDGSGKTEQWNLLAKRMKKAGYPVQQVDFPHYGRMSSGPLQAYLRGVPVPSKDVPAYVASAMYAINRWDVSYDMKAWLAEGKFIIANRYTGSNGGHQGSKILKLADRKLFLRWLFDEEYKRFEIPKPDINIFLKVPLRICLKQIEKRDKMKDEHETKEHLIHAFYAYRDMIKLYPKDFLVINCMSKNRLRKIEGIHEEIWEKIKERFEL